MTYILVKEIVMESNVSVRTCNNCVYYISDTCFLKKGVLIIPWKTFCDEWKIKEESWMNSKK